jgi:hypothetical protein
MNSRLRVMHTCIVQRAEQQRAQQVDRQGRSPRANSSFALPHATTAPQHPPVSTTPSPSNPAIPGVVLTPAAPAPGRPGGRRRAPLRFDEATAFARGSCVCWVIAVAAKLGEGLRCWRIVRMLVVVIVAGSAAPSAALEFATSAEPHSSTASRTPDQSSQQVVGNCNVKGAETGSST